MESVNSKVISALVKFWAVAENPKKTSTNPFHKSKYAPLDEVIAINKQHLVDNGLAVVQSVSGDGEVVTISTIVFHDSGQSIELGKLSMRPAKNDPQGIGSAITYGRRYCLSAALGIASEEDDDGNSGSGHRHQETQPKIETRNSTNQSRPAQSNTPAQQNKPQRLPTEEPKNSELATDAQIKMLFAKAASMGYSESEIKDDMIPSYGKASVKEMTKQDMSELLTLLKPKSA